MSRSSYDYDVIVIGAGIAGMVSAVTANALGKRVAVIEKATVGGNCTNTTCIPSKALISLAHISRDMRHLEQCGLLERSSAGLVTRAIMPHIRGIVQRASEKDLPETFENIGIRMIAGAAEFIDAHHVKAGGQKLSAATFIIAAGTIPLVPNIPGLADVDYVTNETLYRLDDLPRSLVILGGGVDGLEYASAFARLGVQTTVVEVATRLLPTADGEVVTLLLSVLEQEGVKLLTGTRAIRVRKRQDLVVLEVERAGRAAEEVVGERLLIALGRKPDLDGLGLINAGVQYSARGILTDEYLRTTAPNIYACGDNAGPYLLASNAEAQGIVAATNAVLPFKRRVEYGHTVSVIFTEPPLACLGLTEEQARRKHGRRTKVYRFSYAGMRRAMLDGHETGMAKFICDGRGRIAGVHILGEAAPEVIHEAQVIRALKKPLHNLQSLTHANPTYAQALVGRASQLAFLDRMGTHTLITLALRLLPGFSNRIHSARDRLAETGADDRTAAQNAATAPDFPASHLTGQTLVIERRLIDHATMVFDLNGALAAGGASALAQAFGEALAQSRPIMLNASRLIHMDTEGAGLLLVHALMAARGQQGAAVCALSQPLRDVFRLTRLEEVVAIFEDEREALSQARFSPIRTGSDRDTPGYLGPPAPGWARSVGPLSVGGIPAQALNLNVQGRHTTGPVRGFGRLWDKRYRLVVQQQGLEPAMIVARWKAEFPSFWPAGNRFFPSAGAAIAPGTVAVLNLKLPGGLVLATGLRVIYADRTSFSFMSIEGHILAGFITFSCFTEGDSTIIQVHPLFRATDPLMELGFRLGAAAQEDRFWHQTLINLSQRLALRGEVQQRDLLLDARLQWREIGNIRFSAAIRSALAMPGYALGTLKKPDNAPRSDG